LERSDFDAIVRGVVSANGMRTDGPEWTKLWRKQEQVIQRMWQYLQKAAGGSSRITKEQYLSIAQRPDLAAAMAPFTMEGFDFLDHDDDGRITSSELRIGYAHFGLSDAEVDGLFQKLDRDHDGFVTRDEFQKAVQEFHGNANSSSAGAGLAGHV